MSTFSVPVVQISKVGKHPNADTLSLTEVEGCPAIFRTGDFQPGDKAIYIPVDAVVPVDHASFAFLKDREGQTHFRVKARRLRGIFSMGLLIKPTDAFPSSTDLVVGADVSEALGIVKYEESEKTSTGGKNEKDPGFMPVYDLESYRKHKNLFVPGETVVATEKIHGCNARFAFKDGRLWVGSHKTIKLATDMTSIWAKVAVQYKLEEKLAQYPGLVFYGEVYGQVQDLKYDVKPGELRLAFFDIFNPADQRWMDPMVMTNILQILELEPVPVLYVGPYDPAIIEPLADGRSTIASNIREGLVLRPIQGRSDPLHGKIIFKLVGESYLLRKGGTEHH